MKHKDFLTLENWSTEEIWELFELSKAIKKEPFKFNFALKGKTLGLYFEKPSTRTRVSFEVGIYQLGGIGLYLSPRDLQIGRGETIADTARVLSRYLSGIMARTFSHELVVELAKWATIPVINGLTDLLHPCQALTDYFTILEKKGKLKGLKLAFVGDGNNMCHSLAIGAAKTGVNFTCACPKGYFPKEEIIDKAKNIAKDTGSVIEVVEDPKEAVKNADIVYTDVWASMGQEKEREERIKAFKEYQVNMELFLMAKSDAIFMHCLPAHHGEEVTEEVCEHERSVIFDEAENRLHCQKALMVKLMGD